MSQVLILQHLDREGPGRIAEVCQHRGLPVEILRLDLGARVPTALPKDTLLVVLGGSMGVADLRDPRFAFLAREVELLREVLGEGLPVLGVCLGAQLLAHAAGAQVYPNQQRDARGILRAAREIGFGDVHLVGGQGEPVLAGLGQTLPVLHWHGDTFDLPPGAVRLAQSELCRNQAFRIGRTAFGLQFHVEIDAETARAWALADLDFVVAALGPDGPANIAERSEVEARRMEPSGLRLLNNILSQMLDP